MNELKSSLDAFQRFFSVRPAVSLEDRQATYRIRYRVYCEEFRYEPMERFAERMESDELDATATHCLITHLASGVPAGCMRICPGSVNGVDWPLPYERCCADSLDPVAMASVAAPRDRIGESSRFAVDGAFRRRSGETLTRFGEIVSLDLSDTERRTFPLISMVLMLAGLAISEMLERPYNFAIMEPFFPRLLQRFGLTFQRVGRDIDYHGIRAVHFTDSRDFLMNMDAEMRALYSRIRDEIETGLGDYRMPPPEPALRVQCPAVRRGR